MLHFCILSSGIKCLMQFSFCFFAVFWDMLCMITYSLIFISFLLGNFNILLHVFDFVNVEDGDYADFVTVSSHSTGI